MTTATLRHTYTVRRPRAEDADDITALISRAEIAEQGDTDFAVEILLEEWDSLNLETDAWAVVDADGRIVGYGDLTMRAGVQLNSWAVTGPERRGQGIGSHLLELIEQRARERMATEARDGARVTLHNFVNHANREARELLERRGYTVARHYWRMSIAMDSAPPEPEWPQGIELRTFVRGQDERATFDALEDGFRDHWGYLPADYDEWVKQTTRDSFDPSLWFLAVDGEEIAGLSLCSAVTEIPWVGKLAVRRQWRQRGLGLALLRHSFAELWRRGNRTVALGVDSENLTGATRLYERAGMVADRQWDRYEKELRPGDELATHSL